MRITEEDSPSGSACGWLCVGVEEGEWEWEFVVTVFLGGMGAGEHV